MDYISSNTTLSFLRNDKTVLVDITVNDVVDPENKTLYAILELEDSAAKLLPGIINATIVILDNGKLSLYVGRLAMYDNLYIIMLSQWSPPPLVS